MHMEEQPKVGTTLEEWLQNNCPKLAKLGINCRMLLEKSEEQRLTLFDFLKNLEESLK